jgi:S-DNA-T family DNA segregation ATPase FtsK/SpoIIIE
LRFNHLDPHYIIIFDQCPHLLRHKVTSLLLAHNPGNREGNLLRASAIFIDERPPNVNALIDVNGEQLEYWETWAANATENQIKGNAELTSRDRIEHLARSLAPLRTEAGNKAQGGDFPSNVRLVELLGATQTPEIDLSKKYREKYDPLQVMEFPIGINSEGKPQNIILRDDARQGYGSHAMLAGATGKGKSITLQSIVLSLAVNNSPAHLNFVLADFKGGASELARLRDLPHVVGFITDLDEPNVERFRLALEGEVRRRKRILAETPQTLGRQIPDMYEYNREMADLPVPHLVVVIDEFAKALQINPAFKVTLDKDIAAQGRALGIHLILSTQKADDFAGIRPNIEVRMSMQVQSAEDSRAIFNRDDAARKLTRAGQAFIQVGDNRIFEMVQVARTDIPYAPDGADSLELVNDFTIRQIFPNGRYKLLYQKKTKGESESQQVKIVQSEAEVLVAHIKQYCQEHYDNPRMICLPPLPDATGLPLFSLLNKHPVYSRWQMGIGWDQSNMSPAHRLSIPLGMIDNPAEQEQKPFFLDLTDGDGNFVVVGPAGSGKALFLRSLVLGLALTHPPSELIFYFLSQGPTLSIFEDLPHCQAFIQPAETERIMRFFSLLEYEIERRTELMRASRVDSLTSVRLSQPEDLMPTIVIIFDNFGGFSSMHYNRLKDVENLAAVARQVDIHLVLSVGALNSIHWKIQQNISNRLGLGKVNTLEIFRRQAKVLPAKPGRGYIVEDNNILECQIASPTPLPQLDTGNATTITDMSDIISAVNSSWEWPNDQHPLPPILKLPQYIELSSLWESGQVSSEWYDKPTAPIGMDYNLEKVWI